MRAEEQSGQLTARITQHGHFVACRGMYEQGGLGAQGHSKELADRCIPGSPPPHPTEGPALTRVWYSRGPGTELDQINCNKSAEGMAAVAALAQHPARE